MLLSRLKHHNWLLSFACGWVDWMFELYIVASFCEKKTDRLSSTLIKTTFIMITSVAIACISVQFCYCKSYFRAILVIMPVSGFQVFWFETGLCPLLSGPPLQRVQLLFPAGTCDLPASHRWLTSATLVMLFLPPPHFPISPPPYWTLLLPSMRSRSGEGDPVHGVPMNFSLQEP